MKEFVTLLIIFISLPILAQHSVEVYVKDNQSAEPIFGASVKVEGTFNGRFTDEKGYAKIDDLAAGEYQLKVSYTGYQSQLLEITIPATSAYTVSLESEFHEIEEIRVEATRANRSIANLPTRTEVLTDEIDEAASMEPSKIAHLITHSTGIQVQTTSASSNGAVVRIQGLNGRYTQMLKDGFPLFGGFSGSLDILQIPPLDLRQVEYIKGSASTLYGGGAIGGLINLLTKKPGKDETLLHLNWSHIGAKDFNAFASRKFGKFGFTNLASFHMHTPYDSDGNNYSDVPDIVKVNFNPKLFYYPDNRSTIYFGANISNEHRMGGDMNLINQEAPDSLHFYYDRQKSSRYTFQFSADRDLNEKNSIILKSSYSSFNRNMQIRENVLGETTNFSGVQRNSFTELSHNFSNKKHNLSSGLNFYTNEFEEQMLDTNQLRDQEYLTGGVFVNHLWDIAQKFSLESGIRTDYVLAETEYTESKGDFFVLPRMSALYKINRALSVRLGGGMGYRMPTIFNEEAEPYGFKNIAPINFSTVKAEKSYGGNLDLKYQSTFGTENLLLTFNQMFFYNIIDNPILLGYDSVTTSLNYSNSFGELNSRGFETQLKFTFWDFTWFVGYTYTEAFIEDDIKRSHLILTPKHSIKGDLLYVKEDKWRIGWDYEYKSEQLLSSGIQTRALFTTGIIVERTINNFVIFLNAENFTDVRQTRYESILSGPNNTPQFTDIWAPVDGFFFNAGLKIKL